MEKEPRLTEQSLEFPEKIGLDFELWHKYREVHGPEAYKYRRFYEDTAQQLTNLYRFAAENNIELPGPGPDFT